MPRASGSPRGAWRWGALRGALLVAAALLVVGAATLAVLRAGVRFVSPHRAALTSAHLDAALEAQVRALAAPRSTDEAIASALGITDAHLHFGLAHSTSTDFSVRDREGNCIEYAQLFAAVFERVARRSASGDSRRARAWVVHSEARVLGVRLPWRGLHDHDWVLIVDGEGARRALDPTFHDLHLGDSIDGSIVGRVSLPGIASTLPGRLSPVGERGLLISPALPR